SSARLPRVVTAFRTMVKKPGWKAKATELWERMGDELRRLPEFMNKRHRIRPENFAKGLKALELRANVPSELKAHGQTLKRLIAKTNSYWVKRVEIPPIKRRRQAVPTLTAAMLDKDLFPK